MKKQIPFSGLILSLLFLGGCRLPEGAIDKTLGDLRAGPRAPVVDPKVRGLCVAIAPDSAAILNPESDQLQTLGVREADLKDVLLTFFSDSDLNLTLDGDIAGPITFDYKQTTISEAFLSILDSNGLGFRHEGDFIRVSRKETRLYQINYMSGEVGTAGGQSGEANTAGSGSGGFKAILSDVKALAGKEAEVVANESSGTIAVTANTADLKKVEAYLEKVQEVIGRQVLIEARVFEISLSDTAGYGANALFLQGFFSSNNNTGLISDDSLGFDIDTSGFIGVDGGFANDVSGFKFGILRPGQYALAMNAFQTMGQVRILSAPRVMSLNNQTANIELVDKVPVISQELATSTGVSQTITKIEFVDAGISINVTPQITDSGEIWAKISPNITAVGKTITVGGSSAPQLNTRSTNATLHVRDGQTILLGGIRCIRKNEANSGSAILMDIPLIGWLFRNNAQEKGETELIIMMTPTIVSPDLMPFLIEEGLSRVERIQYPFHLNPFNLNNQEDMTTPLPPADQANLTYRNSPSKSVNPEKTITRAGLARLYLYRGIKSYADKKFFEAKSHFEQSLKFNRLRGESQLYLGLIALTQGDRNKAKRHFEERLALDPNDGIALNNRGLIEVLEGHPVIAEPYLRKASLAVPDNPHPWNNLGLVYSMLKENQKAREAFGRALDADIHHAEANYNLARLYDAEGLGQAAMPHYESYLEALPSQSKPQSVHAAMRLLELRSPDR